MVKTECLQRDLTGTCALLAVALLAVGAYAVQPAEDPIGIYFVSPSTGAAGTVVDIRGYGFSATASDNQVAFNAHPAIVLSASADSIRTIVPAIATSGPVTITNSNGIAVSAQSFIVRASSSRQ